MKNKEIERKFLVKPESVPYLTHGNMLFREMSQGYFETGGNEVRVRYCSDDTAYITLKSGAGLVRSEYEYSIPPSDALDIFEDFDLKVVSKTRYMVIDEYDQHWEVDIYKGYNTGLYIAEIELRNEDEKIILPDFILKEVTGEPKYSNKNLAVRHGELK